MTSFVHTHFSARHAGSERIESAIESVGQMRKGFDGTKGLTVMLLAALVSALIVVADQLVDTWVDGHLLAAWVVLWLGVFAAMALLTPTTRQLATVLMGALNAWSVRVARARADDRLWNLAQSDPRVLADIQAAALRAEAEPTVCEAAKRVAKRDPDGRAAPQAAHIWYM